MCGAVCWRGDGARMGRRSWWICQSKARGYQGSEPGKLRLGLTVPRTDADKTFEISKVGDSRERFPALLFLHTDIRMGSTRNSRAGG